MKEINSRGKIKQSEHIYALKIKTESKGLGLMKTAVVAMFIIIQAVILILSYLYFMQFLHYFLLFSLIMTLITCINVLSSDYHGQAKATWIFFLMLCFGFGYIIYFLSSKKILFKKSRKKYQHIALSTQNLKKQIDLDVVENQAVKINCEYLYNSGNFVANTNSKSTYYSSGAQLFDEILDNLKNAKDFIFMEFYIIADGVLLGRFLEILKQKVKEGVDVRIIYDDMGSHGTLKRKTKKEIERAGIKLQPFNRLVPIFNIALNLRDHRKIVVIDGKIGFTGGTNLADEYVNEKRSHGYWKDCGIKVEGEAVDNLTIAFLSQWQFITNEVENYSDFINKAEKFSSNGVLVPFVSGPNYAHSIAQNMYANQIANAREKLYIMTPYFIPDETITNLLINKARSGVDVRIVLPDIADKKFVYTVSRNNVEKMLSCGIRAYTMTSSFVHSKIILTENSAIVGSINMDLRSFNQQFESAVYTNEIETMEQVMKDFIKTFSHCEEITQSNMRRNKFSHRILAGLFNLISPLM